MGQIIRVGHVEEAISQGKKVSRLRLELRDEKYVYSNIFDCLRICLCLG